MYKDWKKVAESAGQIVGQVAKGKPDVAQGFAQLSKAASADGALSEKTKELIALAIAISVRCDTCIALHMKTAVKLGVTRDEVIEMVGVAMYMGGGPSYMYGAQALEAYDQFAEQ